MLQSGHHLEKRGAKGMDFFRVHYGHTKGMPPWKFKVLSSASQIVNERLMKWVQPEQKKQSRANAFQATIFKSSLELDHAALQSIKKI